MMYSATQNAMQLKKKKRLVSAKQIVTGADPYVKDPNWKEIMKDTPG